MKELKFFLLHFFPPLMECIFLHNIRYMAVWRDMFEVDLILSSCEIALIYLHCILRLVFCIRDGTVLNRVEI